MTTFFSAILCKPGGPVVNVVPPDDTSLFNFAPVPIDKKFEGWIDMSSPFTHVTIPKGSRWVYTVYTISETGDYTYPLKANRLVGGPFLKSEEAESLANVAEMSGWFVCIFAALIISDKGKLN